MTEEVRHEITVEVLSAAKEYPNEWIYKIEGEVRQNCSSFDPQ